MNRKLWLQTAACITLVLSTLGGRAQAPDSAMGVRLTGVLPAAGAAPVPATASSLSRQAILFGAGTIGAPAQHLTATFAISGGVLEQPSVAAHFGHDYTVGALQCSSDTCTADVSFAPTLPGNRADALFLVSGGRRVGTFLLGGEGQAPLALLQPAVQRGWAGMNPDQTTLVDDNGTLYTLDHAAATIRLVKSGGEAMLLPVTGLDAPRSMVLDGAGVLYILDSGPAPALTTFDTVRGVQGTMALPVAAGLIDGVALDPAGTLYAVSSSTHMLYTLPGGGVTLTAPLQGDDASGTRAMVYLRGGEVVAGGDSLRIISSEGVGPALARSSLRGPMAGPVSPLSMDAAATLYVQSGAGLLQMRAPDYADAAFALPPSVAVGQNGTLFLSADGAASIDRSQTLLDFGVVAPGGGGLERIATVYNGGNLPLNIASLELAGADFALATPSGDACGAGSVVAPGASCAIGVHLMAAHSGVSRGVVTLTSDSLNRPGFAQTVGLIAHATVPSQAVLTPTSLAFPSTVVNVASAPLTIVLSNPGTAALNFASLGLSGSGSGSYTVTHNCFTTLPASLAPGASCTITVVFKPLGATVQNATLTIGDDVGGVVGSTQSAAISGVGVPAPAPILTVSPATLTFGGTTVPANTTIAPQTLTFTNTGTAPLNITNVTLAPTTGTALPYTFVTTCIGAIAPAANCTVTVTFAPVGGGAFSAAVTLSDNAAGTPQSFAITGSAAANDFTVSANLPSITVPSSGGSAQIKISAAPLPGPFLTPVTFTAFGVPQTATYAFDPPSIAPTNGPDTTTMTISLPPYYPTRLADLNRRSPGGPLAPVLACLVAGLCVGLRRRNLPRVTRWTRIVLLAALGLGASLISGCFGGYPIGGGVPPGTYAITVTGASSNGGEATKNPPFPQASTHSVTFNLIVQ